MANFAKIDENNLVINILHVGNEIITDENGVEQESLGQAHLEQHNNWPANQWIQTSTYTKKNKHLSGDHTRAFRGNGPANQWIQFSKATIKNKHLSGDHTRAFRGNGAAKGYTWFPEQNIFMPPKLYASWVLNETDARWQSPIGDQPTHDTYNTSTHFYRWNETDTTWDLLSYADEGITVGENQQQPADVYGMPWYIWSQ